MSSAVGPHLKVLLSVYRSKDLGGAVASLSRNLQTRKPASDLTFHLHFASKCLPSSWGGGIGSRGRTAGKDTPPSDEPVLSEADLENLHSLIRSGFAAIVPAGYAGSLHGGLSEDELRAEAEWALTNPWRSGVKDHFPGPVTDFVPFRPDAGIVGHLPSDLGGYLSWCIGARVNDSGNHLVFVTAPGETVSIPYLRVGEEDSISRIVKKIKRSAESMQKPVPLLIHIALTPENSEWLLDLVEELGVKGFTFDNTPGLIGSNAEKTHFVPPLYGISHETTRIGPGFRMAIEHAVEQRRLRSGSHDRIRSILFDLSPDGIHAISAPRAEPARKHRTLLSHMQGNASLSTDEFQVDFLHGNLLGFKKQDRRIELSTTDGSWFRVDGAKHFFQSEGAVSFETDISRGLRQSLRYIDTSCKFPGRITVDCYAGERSPLVFLENTMHAPWFNDNRRIEELVPLSFELKLPVDLKQLEIDRRLSDGTSVQENIEMPVYRKQGLFQKTMAWASRISKAYEHEDMCRVSYILPGTRWTLRWNQDGKTYGLSISRLSSETNACSPFELRLYDGESPSVVLLPDGCLSGFLAEELIGLSHHIGFALYPIFEENTVIPDPHPMAEMDADPSYFIRQS